ncbi:MAG: cell division protein ZipA [Porticoccaceae bacterium]|nr:cell division protein ZipA [Porticoccaceae bacterium]
MDFFGPRGLLLVIGVLVVLALVLDGLRRVKRNRYENLHMSSRKLQKSASQYEDGSDSLSDSQFPSGGSRVVGIREDDNFDEIDRLLRGASSEARQGQFDLDDSQEEDSATLEAERAQLEIKLAQQSEVSRKISPSDNNSSQTQDVLAMHLMASKGEMINGQMLLDAVLAVGFRFGGRKIFDRHLNEQGSGDVLFSLANVANPGTFDLNTIADIQTPGVSLFMQLDGLADPVTAFDIMVDTVDRLVAQLHLHVLDETRSSMTKQTIDHYRQRARAAAHRREQGN